MQRKLLSLTRWGGGEDPIILPFFFFNLKFVGNNRGDILIYIYGKKALHMYSNSSSPAKGHIKWSSLVAHLPYSVRVEDTKVPADLEKLEMTPETFLQVTADSEARNI